MDKLEILAKVEKYFENEYKTLCHILKDCDWAKSNPQRFIHQSMSACCAIVMFCQELNVDYESLNKLYEPYYEKFRKLLLTF